MDFGQAFVDAIADAVAARLRSTPVDLKPRLLTVEQAAQYLGRSEKSVRHLQASGALPVVKLDGRVQFDVKDLDKVIDTSKA